MSLEQFYIFYRSLVFFSEYLNDLVTFMKLMIQKQIMALVGAPWRAGCLVRAWLISARLSSTQFQSDYGHATVN